MGRPNRPTYCRVAVGLQVEYEVAKRLKKCLAWHARPHRCEEVVKAGGTILGTLVDHEEPCRNLKASVKRGEWAIVYGPSGSGKSA